MFLYTIILEKLLERTCLSNMFSLRTCVYVIFTLSYPCPNVPATVVMLSLVRICE